MIKTWKKVIIPTVCLMLTIPGLASAHTVSTVSSSTDLRVLLDEKLGEHALLAIVAMQKGIDGTADFGDVAAALNANTDDLAGAIASVYGKDAGAAFKTMWSAHIGDFVDYVKATAAKDETGRQAALAKLDQYRADFSKFLAGANPNLKADDLAAGLQIHVNELVAAFDKYVNKDYAGAYAAIRESYSHMFMTGDALSGAIAKQFDQTFTNGEVSNKAADLRVLLDEKLGEHAMLAIIAMQKGIDGSADFANSAAALNANTDDLASAIASVYGADAGAAFKTMWSAHIGFFVDYVKATAAKDEAGRQAALAKLDQYRADFSKFLAGANPNLNADDLSASLQVHVNELVAAFDKYASKDYPGAYSAVREAYAHMFMTGDALAGAIVKQFNEKFHDAAPAGDNVALKLQIGSTNLDLNGKITVMDTKPFLKDGWTFISLRYLSEAIGAQVTWDGDSQTVWVKNGSNTLTFWIGKDYMEVNGQRKAIGSPVFLKDDRTQVPLRFMTELLGWDVQWNDSDWSILLTKSMMMGM